MPQSFQASQSRSIFTDLIQVPAFSQLNYTDKSLWSALYGDETESLKENIRKEQSAKEVKEKLIELQSMVGRLTLSPVVYSLGLLDLQKFLRTDIKQPKNYLDVIKEVRQQWRATLRNQQVYALENFFTDVNQAIYYVIEAKWEVQTAQDVLNYYWHIINESTYQSTFNIVKNFFNEFYGKKLAEESIVILENSDVQAVTQQLQQEFINAVAKLPNIKEVCKEENSVEEINTTEDSTQSYLDKAWSVTKALQQYVIEHPIQAITLGLAAQAAAVSAFNFQQSSDDQAECDEFRVNCNNANDQSEQDGSAIYGVFYDEKGLKISSTQPLPSSTSHVIRGITYFQASNQPSNNNEDTDLNKDPSSVKRLG